MSIFGKIKAAIFGSHDKADAPAAAPATITQGSAAAATTASAATPAIADVTTTSQPVTAPVTTPAAPVDVAALLDGKVKASGQKLNWRTSVVDLMKALGMDANLAERKELADELGYTGDKNDSATMNIWLHKALLKKLSENGGNVPADLLD